MTGWITRLRCNLQVHHILPNLGAAAVMGAILTGMILRPAWYISHRAGLQLLLRILRCVQLIRRPYLWGSLFVLMHVSGYCAVSIPKGYQVVLVWPHVTAHENYITCLSNCSLKSQTLQCDFDCWCCAAGLSV